MDIDERAVDGMGEKENIGEREVKILSYKNLLNNN
jgi:hypothetical protein